MEITKVDNRLDPNPKEPFVTMPLGEIEMDTAEMDNELDPKEPSTTTSPGETHELTDEKPNGERIGDESLKYPQGVKLATIILALCLAVFLVALDQTIISTAIPKITDAFHSVDDIGW